MALPLSTRLASQDLPPASMRERIVNATRAAVRLVAGANRDGAARLSDCLLCAYVGAIVTSALTGKSYRANAGSLQVRIVQRGEPLFMEAQTHAVRPAQYHAWFAARQPGGRMEVVDLCAHHYPAETHHFAPARSGGVGSWYVWGWADTLLPDIRFAVDTAAEDDARTWYNRHVDLVNGMAEHAFKLVHEGRFAA